MDKKILNQIQKLLSLGNNTSFEGEAKAALEKAYELMNRYNLSHADLEAAEKDKELGPLGEYVLNECTRAFNWEKIIKNSIADLFNIN